MAIGDTNDVLNRLNVVLPPWFGEGTLSILPGILAGFANQGVTLYNQFFYVKLQTRISTATDINLDQIAVDFFGVNGFLRSPNEGDISYRNRILVSILRERATRRGMITILTLLTGTAPLIVEPMRPADLGGYSIAGVGYDVGGAYGNPKVPYQCFITVFSPTFSTIANVAGWNIATGAWSQPGSNEVWSNLGDTTNALNAAEIYAAINSTKCEGTICWVKIVSPS